MLSFMAYLGSWKDGEFTPVGAEAVEAPTYEEAKPLAMRALKGKGAELGATAVRLESDDGHYAWEYK